MPSPPDLHTWRELEVIDSDGERLGHLADIYRDETTGDAAFLLIRGGRFGNKLHFVPIEGATLEGDIVRVNFAADEVNSAPNISADESLSHGEEQRLYRHYDMDHPSDETTVLVVLVAD